MKHQRYGSITFLAGLISLSLVGCQAVTMTPHQVSGYPEQEGLSFVPPFQRPDLESRVSPASPVEVTRLFGPEFASLPRLGVVLILVTNKGSENPIAVFRQTVHVTLPGGRVLRPLEPSEMIAWFDEVYGSTLGKPGKEAIFGRWDDKSRKDYEEGVIRVSKGEPRGAVVVFRFPQGILSGTFPVEYVLDLEGGEQVPVKGQELHLNLRP